MARVVQDYLISTPLLHDHTPEYDDRYVNVTGDTMTGPLTLEDLIFNGATGTNTITLPDNLADALSVIHGGNDFMVFDTTDGTESLLVNHDVKHLAGKKVVFDGA